MTIFRSVQDTSEVTMEELIRENESLKQGLRSCHAMNQALLDLSPYPISITRLDDGRYLLVNRRWSKITGFSPESVIGKTRAELNFFVNDEDREQILEALRRDGRVKKFETRLRTKDGASIHAQISASIIEYNCQECLLTLTTNIDALSKAQKALRQSENRFRNILNSISESYYEVNLNGQFTFYNNSTADLFGRSLEELKGLNYRDVTTLEDVDKVANNFNEIYQGNVATKLVEYGILKPNGTVLQVESSVSLLRNDEDKAVGFYGILRDRTKQKEAEKTLRRSEEKYRGILEEMEEGYFEVDLNGNFIYFNEATPGIYGYPAEELMNMGYQQYLSPEQTVKHYRLFDDIRQTGMPIKYYEYEIIHKDGSVSFAELSGYPLRSEDGEIIGFWCITRDRTEQRKAEIALRRSEEKYRRILEDMEENYYELDLSGNFTDFNASTCRYHGYSADEMMGMNFRHYLSPKQAEMTRKIFEQIHNTGEPVKLYDLEIINKDRSLRSAEASAYLLKDEQGKAIGFWGISRDRTEKRRAEKALQKSEERYRLLVSNAGDGIYITQEDRIIFNNPKTAKITGYSETELLGLKFSDLLHPEERADLYQSQYRKLLEEGATDVFSFRILNKEHQSIWVELNAIGISWEGRPAVLNFLRDVTHLKKTEARLQQAQKMEAIGTLAGGIAHDFNNILHAILGFAELALDDSPTASPQSESLQDLLNGCRRASELVQQILAFARQSEEKVEPIMVRPIVKEALKLIRSTIPSTIEIRSKIISKSKIKGNPTQVHQIIMNLCANAAHAMEKTGGILTVELKDIRIDTASSDASLELAEGDYLKLAVSDTGGGIPNEIIHSIFEPYFTTKAQGEGTGMGLSVVQGIVEKYGGKVAVQSQLGMGSVFTIYLPICFSKTGSYRSLDKVLPICSERILFVDDEAMIAKMASRSLQRFGYQVTTQTCSLEALKLFREKSGDFDIVVTDMTMPQMTGDQLASELMRIRPDIPVVLCSGYSKKINKDQATAMGIKAFVDKPIEKDDLAVTIRKVLDDRNQNSAPGAL